MSIYKLSVKRAKIVLYSALILVSSILSFANISFSESGRTLPKAVPTVTLTLPTPVSTPGSYPANVNIKPVSPPSNISDEIFNDRCERSQNTGKQGTNSWCLTFDKEMSYSSTKTEKLVEDTFISTEFVDLGYTLTPHNTWNSHYKDEVIQTAPGGHTVMEGGKADSGPVIGYLEWQKYTYGDSNSEHWALCSGTVSTDSDFGDTKLEYFGSDSEGNLYDNCKVSSDLTGPSPYFMGETGLVFSRITPFQSFDHKGRTVETSGSSVLEVNTTVIVNYMSTDPIGTCVWISGTASSSTPEDSDKIKQMPIPEVRMFMPPGTQEFKFSVPAMFMNKITTWYVNVTGSSAVRSVSFDAKGRPIKFTCEFNK